MGLNRPGLAWWLLLRASRTFWIAIPLTVVPIFLQLLLPADLFLFTANSLLF